jgi:hypothetical protein
VLNGVNAGFIGDSKRHGTHTALPQQIQEELTSGLVASRHHQRAAPGLSHNFAGLAGGARTENDAASGGKFEQHNQPLQESGPTGLNFTLVRGSAIMGATVSRQTW